MLDEDLALKLFRVADPLGRKAYINGESYEVIGIAGIPSASGNIRRTRRIFR